VTEERALVSVIGPTAGSGVRIEHWRYTAAFSRGPGRPCHTVYLNPPGIRYEGRIGDRHVRCDGAQHSIGIVPAGADCCLQVHASAWDVFALCVEPDRYSAFALNAGLPTADFNEDLIDKDATMHHLCRALASSSDEPGSSGTLLWEAISQSILTHLVGRYARHRPPAPGSLGSAALSRTLGYINDNLDGDVSIEAMADIAGLSRSISAGPSPARRDIRRIATSCSPASSERWRFCAEARCPLRRSLSKRASPIKATWRGMSDSTTAFRPRRCGWPAHRH
jgi:hypothetical protein